MKYPQMVTYWARGTSNGFTEESYVSPIVINVRWEDKSERFLTDEGEELRSRAVVYSQINLDLKGFLYLGSSLDPDPNNVPGSFQIMRFDKTTNLNGTKTERKAWLN